MFSGSGTSSGASMEGQLHLALERHSYVPQELQRQPHHSFESNVNAVLTAQLMKAEVPAESIDTAYLVQAPQFARPLLPEHVPALGVGFPGRDLKTDERLIDNPVIGFRLERGTSHIQGQAAIWGRYHHRCARAIADSSVLRDRFIAERSRHLFQRRSNPMYRCRFQPGVAHRPRPLHPIISTPPPATTPHVAGSSDTC